MVGKASQEVLAGEGIASANLEAVPNSQSMSEEASRYASLLRARGQEMSRAEAEWLRAHSRFMANLNDEV